MCSLELENVPEHLMTPILSFRDCDLIASENTLYQSLEGTKTSMRNETHPRPDEDPSRLAERRGERILLVEDEQLLARMWEGILGHLGYQVSIRTNSSEALEMFLSNPQAFDLVITDQVMPGLTGTELVGSLRDVRPDIPIILMTGFCDTVTPELIERLRIQAFIMKPISTLDLAQKIRSALQM